MVDGGRPLKVLHVSQPVSGGVARWVEILAADQRARGWDVWVACPRDGWLPERLREVGQQTRAWDAVRSPASRGTLGEVGRLRSIVRDLRPDVVHLHSSKAGMIGRMVIHGGIPTICQPHSWSFHATTGRMRGMVLRWERLAARWADVLLCVSETERQEGADAGVLTSRVRVIHNGVDVTGWPYQDRTGRAKARTSLGLDQSVPLAVTVGRLCEQKGQDLVVRAWPSVSSRVPGASLALVGDGPARAELEVATADQAGIQLVGESDQIATWLAAADVVVLPSRWEGLALALLEAAATGRSIVATDVGGVREVLGAGAAGAVVSGSGETVVSHLAAAIAVRLADRDLADEEGVAARRRIEDGFTLGAALDATARLTLGLVPVPSGTAATSRSAPRPRRASAR
ncbi:MULTISPECIES: glycosyltransferase [Pseudofrankia]|uniref:glycosyltransferase n=1 Tax=Pseudofrankia TaxID=2994363 RepID=UPI0009F6BF8F|nr:MULTISPECIES: glycosyltransferase [Pseudofrankia]